MKVPAYLVEFEQVSLIHPVLLSMNCKRYIRQGTTDSNELQDDDPNTFKDFASFGWQLGFSKRKNL